jgi:N-terminal 7TM region of histidine kinase
VRCVGEVRPSASGLDRRQGIQRAQTPRWVTVCVAAASAGLLVAAAVLAYLDRHLVPASQSNWDFSYFLGDVPKLAACVTGGIIAYRRPGNRIGWLFLAIALALGVNFFAGAYALHALVAAPGSWPGGQAMAWLNNWIWPLPLAMVAFVFLLFPTGQLRSSRWRFVAWFVAAAFALVAVTLMGLAASVWSHPFVPSDQTPVHSNWTPLALTAGLILMSAGLLLAAAALVVRFIRSVGEERLQLKWFAAAAVLVLATLIPSLLTNSVIPGVLTSLAFVCLFAAIAIAVLKYRLYEIDRIISRTLAYAIVTALLIGVYAAVVLLATRVLPFHTPVAVAGATLLAAALFNPLRRRVQRAVDRRFNRARYDADTAITTFAAQLREAVDLDTVRADLLGAVHAALEPAHVSVWISQRD